MKPSVACLAMVSGCALPALACVLLFDRLGAGVDAQGLLHGPFALIALACLFFAAALSVGVRYWRSRTP